MKRLHPQNEFDVRRVVLIAALLCVARPVMPDDVRAMRAISHHTAVYVVVFLNVVQFAAYVVAAIYLPREAWFRELKRWVRQNVASSTKRLLACGLTVGVLVSAALYGLEEARTILPAEFAFAAYLTEFLLARLALLAILLLLSPEEPPQPRKREKRRKVSRVEQPTTTV